MAREFTKVSGKLWSNKSFSDLPGSDAKLLFLYLFAGPHQNSAGCFKLPTGYAATDLKWTPEQYVQVRGEVASAGLIDFDQDTDEIIIIDWFSSNPPMNQKHAQACQRLVENIESERLGSLAVEAFTAAYAVPAVPQVSRVLRDQLMEARR